MTSVNSLNAIADLLAIISHSIIKEQMYVLSEYFTTLYYLRQMSSEDIRELQRLALESRLRTALSVHLSISATIHKRVYGSIPKNSRQLLENTGQYTREIVRIMKNDFSVPYIYHPLSVFEVFAEKMVEPTARRSLSKQIHSMANPAFLSSFIWGVFNHITRKSY